MSSYEIRRWILDRLGEKGTWRALASLAALFGLMVAPDQLEVIGAGIIVLINLYEVKKKES